MKAIASESHFRKKGIGDQHCRRLALDFAGKPCQVISKHLRRDQAIEAGATADIDDPLTGLELADAKGVARAGEGAIEPLGRPSS